MQAAALSGNATLGGDIGLDSLSRVELLAAIEDSLGVYLDESRIGPDTTIAELERTLSDIDGQSVARPVFPSWPRSPLAKATRGAAQVPTFALLRAVVSVDVSGREWLAGLTPPVLFVANHTSHLDTPTVLRSLPASWRRRTAVAAAADYFFARTVVGAGVGLLLNAFPFSRTAAIRPTLEHCGRLFDEGWSILLYPEGTRSTDGLIAPFKTGVGLIAMDLGVPVVPIAIEGLGSVLPKGRMVPHRGRATIAFGPPLTFEKGTSYAAATAEIESAVRRLLVDR